MNATTPIIRVSRATASPPEPVDLQPTSTYEAITRQMVVALSEDVKEIKSRTNTIFYVVIGSIILDMLARWIGG
ncbi:MAG TPA: hypothetical protein VNZ58_08465 [Thermomicrobiales bacterium]|nr:hypothetical protein [Thermomicrobiales bacterium]